MATQPTKPRGILPPRAKSTNSHGSKLQTRTLKTEVPKKTVYKTKSDTNLAERLENLSLQNGAATNVRYGRSAGKHGYKSLEDVAHCILTKQAKNVVVMAGAGISTPSGIPDFRTPGTGLYDNLRQYRIPQPESIFDIEYFERNPRPFYTLAKELYPTGHYRPNYVHYFLKLLHIKGILLRVYTQNIDGLERIAGIPPQKLVEAHGSFQSASCVKCRQPHPIDSVRETILCEKIPKCRKDGCSGNVKPDIVFFGQDLPRRFYYYLRDFPQADMLIVMGTSLGVEPFASIVDSSRIYVPRVLFNREAVAPFDRKRRMNDMVVEGDIVAGVCALVRNLGWKEDLENILTGSEQNPKLPDESNVDNMVHVYAPPEKSFPSKTRQGRPRMQRNFLGPRRNARKPSIDSDSSTTESSEDSSDSSTSSDDSPPPTRTRFTKFVRRMPVTHTYTRKNSNFLTKSSSPSPNVKKRSLLNSKPRSGSDSASSSNASRPDSASSTKTTMSSTSKISSGSGRSKCPLESNAALPQKNKNASSLSSASTNFLSRKKVSNFPIAGSEPDSSSNSNLNGVIAAKAENVGSTHLNHEPSMQLKQRSESRSSISRSPSQSSLTKQPQLPVPHKPPQVALTHRNSKKPPIGIAAVNLSSRRMQTLSAHPQLQSTIVQVSQSRTADGSKANMPNLPKIPYRHKLQHFANPKTMQDSSPDVSLDESSENSPWES